MGHVHRFWTTSLGHIWPLYLIVLTVFGLGVLLGTLGVNTLQDEQINELQGFIETFLVQAPELNIDRAQMAGEALRHNLFWGAAMYILGLTIICLPLILAFIFTQGFTLGFTISFLTQGAQGQGMAVVLVSMLPQNLMFIPAMIIGGATSLSFSFLLLRRFFNSSIRVWPSFVGYTAIMMGVLVAFSLAALTEAYITPDITRFSASFLVN